MINKKKITILILALIIIILFAILAYYYSLRGYIKITTDFPEIQYSLDGQEIDTRFVLTGGKFETTVPVRPGRRIFKASTDSGKIVKEKKLLIKNQETNEVIIEVERGELRNYMLEGE